MRVGALMALVAFTLPVVSSHTAPGSSPRDLPSLKVRWTWDGQADRVVVSDGIAYVWGGGALVALQGATGAVIWKKEFGERGFSPQENPVVLGDVVVVGWDNKLLLLDAGTGAVVHSLDLGAPPVDILGPPLIVRISDEEKEEILSVDEVSGEVRARRDARHLSYRMELQDGDLICIENEAHAAQQGEPTRLTGLRAEDLADVWRIEVDDFEELTTIDGQMYLECYPEEPSSACDQPRGDGRFLPLDPSSGELGEPLPAREPSSGSHAHSWEIQCIEEDDRGGPEVHRRNNLATGGALWKVTLPAAIEAQLVDGDRWYVHCGSGSGRGVFVVVDWRTGVIREKAYGLREVDQLIKCGSLLLASILYDGIVAFSPEEFGPPEAASKSVQSEVHRILWSKELVEKRCWWQHMEDAAKELEELGPGALPFVVGEIPKVADAAIVPAARVAAEAEYRPASPALASRLSGLHRCSDLGWDQHVPPIAVLRALAKIGGEAEIDAVAKFLMDASREGNERLEAFACLVSIGGERVIPILDRAVDSLTPKPHRWWSPPDPGRHLDRLGHSVSQEEIMDAHDKDNYEEGRWLAAAASSARVWLPDGTELIVFPHEQLGGSRDYWLIERPPTGIMKPARFIGGCVHREWGDEDAPEPTLLADCAEGVLRVSRADGKGGVASIVLADLSKDSDGDGLTDLVEKRMRIDPMRTDTDSDGIADGEDLAPNALIHSPRDERDEIAFAIFQQFHAFEKERGLAAVQGQPAMEWRGRDWPTITLTEAENGLFIEEGGLDGVPHITIEPGPQRLGSTEEEESPQIDLGTDERVYSLTIFRGGLNGVGYDIVVRKLGTKWYMRQKVERWVS